MAKSLTFSVSKRYCSSGFSRRVGSTWFAFGIGLVPKKDGRTTTQPPLQLMQIRCLQELELELSPKHGACGNPPEWVSLPSAKPLRISVGLRAISLGEGIAATTTAKASNGFCKGRMAPFPF